MFYLISNHFGSGIHRHLFKRAAGCTLSQPSVLQFLITVGCSSLLFCAGFLIAAYNSRSLLACLLVPLTPQPSCIFGNINKYLDMRSLLSFLDQKPFQTKDLLPNVYRNSVDVLPMRKDHIIQNFSSLLITIICGSSLGSYLACLYRSSY